MGEEPNSLELPEEGYLFLAQVDEPSNNDFRVIATPGTASGTAVNTEVGPAFPVVTDDASRAFEFIWRNYVAYAILNESYARPDHDQAVGTRRFGRKASSAFLIHVAATTWATDDYPGTPTHWYLNGEHHCLDVVSIAPLELRELRAEEARAAVAKFGSRSHGVYQAAASDTPTRS